MMILWCPFCQKHLTCNRTTTVKDDVERTIWSCPNCGTDLASKDSHIKPE